MVLRLPAPLEDSLIAQARQRGVSPEDLALSALRERFLPETRSLEPIDEWERKLFAAALDCGFSVSDAVLSSDGLYE